MRRKHSPNRRWGFCRHFARLLKSTFRPPFGTGVAEARVVGRSGLTQESALQNRSVLVSILTRLLSGNMRSGSGRVTVDLLCLFRLAIVPQIKAVGLPARTPRSEAKKVCSIYPNAIRVSA